MGFEASGGAEVDVGTMHQNRPLASPAPFPGLQVKPLDLKPQPLGGVVGDWAGPGTSLSLGVSVVRLGLFQQLLFCIAGLCRLRQTNLACRLLQGCQPDLSANSRVTTSDLGQLPQPELYNGDAVF